MTPFDEEGILKPKDPLLDEDEWAEIPLSSVEIYDEKTHELTSLLHADEELPLTVSGKLGPLPANLRHLLLDRSSLPTPITITNVQRFAYGQYDDGEAIFWAAGKAGWYKIRPGRSYRSIYKLMEEAIEVLFFTSDFYREAKSKKQRQAPVEDIFAKYAEQPKSLCSDAKEAAAIFQKHRQFLLDSMSKGKEGINWRYTPIYEYMVKDPSESNSSSSDSETDALSDESQVRPVGKGKSALRPRSGKYSVKSAGRRRDPDAVELGEQQESTPTVPKTKRKDRSSSHGGRARKRAQTIEAIEMDSPMLSPDETDSSIPNDTKLPLRERPVRSNGRFEQPTVEFVQELLPSYEPQGPGDTWYCSFDGCSHKVYGARSSEGKVLIKEHFMTHAVESQSQIDLVYREERPYLPVNNLIKRIREMAAQQVGGTPTKDPFPKPIERRS